MLIFTQIVGQMSVEVEESRKKLLPQWLGHKTAEWLHSASKLFESDNYPLPGENE